MTQARPGLVLVTGGSGFIAAHCILQLLQAGWQVRATLRSLDRESGVRAMLAAGGMSSAQADSLAFMAADLLSDAGWPEAAAGCSEVLHLASPFPLRVPRHEDELIAPARDGALRVLRAARDAGVRRVVMTSSFAAVGYGNSPSAGGVYTEQDWTQAGAAGLGAYVRSKTLAEKAAWDFMAREGAGLQLATVNPVVVLGPVLGRDSSSSIQVVQRLLEGSVPGLPRLSFGLVDVRDVADLHLRAMTHPDAAGERFLAVAGDFMSMAAIAALLRQRLGETARRVPTRQLPDWLVKLVSIADPSIRQIVPELGRGKQASHDKARRMLGWNPRSNEECVMATAESLLRLGLIRQRN